MEKTKAIWYVVLAGLMGRMGILAIPVLLLVVCNIIDYGTGICAAKCRNEKISSYRGVKGIYKKVGMWILVVIGGLLDVLINYSMQYAGIDFQIPFIVATLVSVWLVLNEMISILENLVDIGVELPPFLMPIIKQMKGKVEQEAEQKEEADE